MENELKTALYCRTAQVCDMGIAKQEAMLRQYADDNNLGNIAVFYDNGYSGLNLSRPAIRQLEADAVAGFVGLVVVTDVTRISRNFYDVNEFLDSMADIGVEVKYSTADNDDESISALYKLRQEVYLQYLKSKRQTDAV